MTLSPVSVVIPVHNGRRTLPAVLRAIGRECAGRPFEIITVDDASTDGSWKYLQRLARQGRVRALASAGRGISAAINTGIREASHPFIAQIDQDVIVKSGWLDALLTALADPELAAAQGHYVAAEGAGFWARVMGRDLEWRYARIRQMDVDHVCTGNTIYRSCALHHVGLFDESFGYGSDNDMSYRLIAAGHRLGFCKEARAVHLWRETARAYLRQQFGVGYGRLDLIAKHPRRVSGDAVSGVSMILHAPLMFAVLLLMIAACISWLAGVAAGPFAWTAGLLLLALLAERLSAGIAAWRRTGDRTTLGFPVAHTVRDVAWAAAIVVWGARRMWRVGRSPEQSMSRGRSPSRAARAHHPGSIEAHRVLVLIPAFNEGSNLRRVVEDIRHSAPDFDVLVVNDGSTDATVELLPQLGVQWLSLPDRVGVGGAVRTGLRFARRRGYEYVIRIDGDGQHRGRDMTRLLLPVAGHGADVTLGSRYIGRHRSLNSFSKSALSVVLTLLTGRRITDPTSGCWAFGPRAVRLLADSHPTGYGEPELLLLLYRLGLTVEEVAVPSRPRHSGQTTLTSSRKAVALARTVLAMMMVPIRRVEQEGGARGE